MNRPSRLLALSAGILILAGCGAEKSKLKTDNEQFSYAIGVEIGRSLDPISADLDFKALKHGMNDVQAKKELAFTDEEMEKIKMTVAQTLMEKQQQKRTADGETALKKGEEFLAANAKKDNIVTTESGLQYEVLTEGDGDNPAATDIVTVHYKGTLINGETFDSSYDRGQPIQFPLDRVIPGWTEGVQLMKKGAKHRLFIPASLGYGEMGSGEKIGPNEALIFEVELIDVTKP